MASDDGTRRVGARGSRYVAAIAVAGLAAAVLPLGVTRAAPGDNPPTAVTRFVTLLPGANTVTLEGSDPEGTDVTFALATLPSAGEVGPISTPTCDAGTCSATVTYTPADPAVSDSFTYIANNGALDSEPATVVLTGNQAPFGIDQTAYFAEEPIALQIAGGDPESQPMTLAVGSGPANGDLSPLGTPACSFGYCTADVTYTPDPGFRGNDSFTFTVSDGVQTAQATVTLIGNQTPAAYDQTVRITSPTTSIVLSGFDPELAPLAFAVATAPTIGTLTIDGVPTCDGSSTCTQDATYTPGPGTTDADTFQFTVSDGTNTSAPATVFLQRNAAPDANPDAVDVIGSVPADVYPLGNDFDANSDALTIVAFDAVGTAGGTVSCTPEGTCTYAAPAGFTGTDTFTYTVSDGELTAVGTVTVNVRGAAVISNGIVSLGVWAEGHLNVPGADRAVGLRYEPTGNESTAPGCLCEGWGAADATTGTTGYANEATDGGPVNLDLISFASDATTATAVVEIDGVIRVTHAYRPSTASSNLYEVAVTMENISGAPVEPRYRRVMDWDIEPTAFSEFVTLETGTAAGILFTSDNGFATANPLGERGSIAFTGEAVDSGPADHGALFDFGFDTLAPGGSVTFMTYYGAAGTEADALDALRGVGAEAYSLGQPSTTDGPTLGTPNTFVFGFTGIGGTSAFEPVAVAGDDVTVAEGSTVGLDGSASIDPDGTITSYAWTPPLGIADPGAAVTTFVPADNGEHALTLQVCDDNDPVLCGSDQRVVTATNVAPTVVAAADTSVSTGVATIDPIAAYTDPGSADTHTATIDWGDGTAPDGPAAVAGGGVVGTHTFAASGTFTAQVCVTDDDGGTGCDTVAITVTGVVNHPPTAVDDTAMTTEGTPIVIDVLANDSDPDDDALTVVAVTAPVGGGTAVVAAGGTAVEYTPAACDVTDSFTYSVSDGTVIATATVTVTITCAPVCTAVVATLATGEPGTDDGAVAVTVDGTGAFGTAAGFGSDATFDPVGPVGAASTVYTSNLYVQTVDQLLYDDCSTPVRLVSQSATELVTAFGRGGLEWRLTQRVVSTPTGALLTQTYELTNDGGDAVTTALVRHVDGDLAFDNSIADRGGAQDASGELLFEFDASDSADRPATFIGISGALDGAVTPNRWTIERYNYRPAILAADGIPAADDGVVSGDADGNLFVDTPYDVTLSQQWNALVAPGATVVFSTVTDFGRAPTNLPPVAADDTASTDVDTPVTIDVLANDTDPDGDPLRVIGTTGPAVGTVVVGADGSVTYTPGAGATGDDTFTYTVTDGRGGVATGTVTVTIAAANVAPVADDVAVATEEDVPVALTLSGSDADGDPLVFAVVTGPSAGSVSCDGAVCTYTPNADVSGVDSFTFSVSDGRGGSDEGTVTVTVAPVNDAPVVVGAATVAVPEGSSVTLAVTVTDVDSSAFSYAWSPAGGLSDASAAAPVFAAVDDGSFPFAVTVCDDAVPAGCVMVADAAVVSVSNMAPVVDAVAEIEAAAGLELSATVASIRDVGVADTHTATIDWGDGTVIDGPVGVSGAVSGAHTYASPGGYPVTVCVTDDDGGVTCETTAATVTSGLPVLEIRDASVIEGDSGLRTMELVVALSSPVDRAVRVGWATSPETATPGAGTIIFPEDYRTTSGTARIATGATETVVRVPVGGDVVAEGDETLFVDLSAPINAVIGDGHAVGTILDGGDGCTIVGTNGDDVLVGTDGDDVLCGLRGNDRYDPRGGDDRLIDLAGTDMLTYELAPNGVVVDLAAGEATGWGTDGFASIEHATGSAHDDILAGTDVANDLTGLEGDDRLVGLGGPDDLLGGAGADDLDGGGGNDIVIGGDGADVISGALGADVLSGDSGSDTLSGGDGGDLLLGGAYADVLNGGAGNDVLSGDAGDDDLVGAAGRDTLFGSDGTDRLAGDSGDDVLDGGSGDDALSGGAGRDQLDGGAGDDRSDGGDGLDTCALGGPADELVSCEWS